MKQRKPNAATGVLAEETASFRFDFLLIGSVVLRGPGSFRSDTFGIVLLKRLVTVAILAWCATAPLPAGAQPPSFHVTIPLYFGGGHRREQRTVSPASERRTERRLRLVRYGLQLADAIISAIGYRAYATCLSCLAFPGGGPLGGARVSIADFSNDRPAESNPVIAPFSHGGFAALSLGTIAFDLIDTRIERRWSVERREASDLAEIGAHLWGISTWIPELKAIHRDSVIAAACGAQWHAQQYGQAFSEGCVNEFYRPNHGTLPLAPPSTSFTICAPPRFAYGTSLFATATQSFVASGVACGKLNSPFN